MRQLGRVLRRLHDELLGQVVGLGPELLRRREVTRDAFVDLFREDGAERFRDLQTDADLAALLRLLLLFLFDGRTRLRPELALRGRLDP